MRNEYDMNVSMTATPPLSIAIITRNEEKNIGRCLASCAFADEAVVVDTRSSDRTVEIAKEMGARVIDHEWLGFGPQKQMAVDACENDWVLILDADEEIPPATAQRIREAIRSDAADAYVLPRRNFIGAREIRYGSWRKDAVLRLFRKSLFSVTPRQVHEEVRGRGRVKRFPAHAAILHHSFAGAADFIAKAARYAAPGAAQMASEGRTGSLAGAMGHAAWTFVFNYVFRLGMLDGGWGLVIAVSDAVGCFYKHAILWDLTRNRRGQDSPRSS